MHFHDTICITINVTQYDTYHDILSLRDDLDKVK